MPAPKHPSTRSFAPKRGGQVCEERDKDRNIEKNERKKERKKEIKKERKTKNKKKRKNEIEARKECVVNLFDKLPHVGC